MFFSKTEIFFGFCQGIAVVARLMGECSKKTGLKFGLIQAGYNAGVAGGER